MAGTKQVALCVTCVVDQIMPEVGVAAVRLLRRAGYEVIFPPAQTCCGQPFFNSGFQDEARRLARRAIDIFADYEAVVLPSGSCTTMMRLEYPHLLEDEPQWYYRARRLAAKTYELSEFLVHQAGWSSESSATAETGGQRPAPSVTYHDSCHMCRLLHLKQEPRTLLADAGCQVKEMAEPDRCCGFGGLFSIRIPEVSNAMTAEKLRQATATGADVLITADPGCLMQLRGMMQLRGQAEEIRVEHIATVLEQLT